MTIHLMKLSSTKGNTELVHILTDIFDLVVRSAITRLRNTTRLQTLVAHEEERDSKKRQKYEAIMEEMSNVCMFMYVIVRPEIKCSRPPT